MRNFFKTVAIVTVFSVSEKFLGFLYRIYLSRTIGSEGIGIYQVALSVFGLIYTLCCSGIPVTVSRLMTKYKTQHDNARVEKVITAGILITLLTVIPVCALLYLFGGKISFLFADERSFLVFKIMLPGLVFTSVYSVLRGVFWGNKDFFPYSVIELLEEICMITAGIILVSVSSNILNGAIGTGVAVLISYIFSFSLAAVVFIARKNKLNNPRSEIKTLLKSSLPITAMRSANSLASSLVSIILPLKLVSAGYTEAQAMSVFGSALGQALPILFIPTNLISSFTLVIIPEISENYYSKKHFYLKRDIEKAIKFSTLTSIIFVTLFAVCGEEIGIVVFGEHRCGKYLTASSFLVIFMSLSSISTGILNSMGLETKTLIYYLISGIIMLLCIWFLPAVAGIYALLIGFAFVYVLTTVLNLRLINKNCLKKPEYLKYLIKCGLTIIPSLIFGFFLKKVLLRALGTFFTLVICSVAICSFNLLLLFALGLIDLNFTFIKLKEFLKKSNKKPLDTF